MRVNANRIVENFDHVNWLRQAFTQGLSAKMLEVLKVVRRMNSITNKTKTIVVRSSIDIGLMPRGRHIGLLCGRSQRMSNHLCLVYLMS